MQGITTDYEALSKQGWRVSIPGMMGSAIVTDSIPSDLEAEVKQIERFFSHQNSLVLCAFHVS
jgi:hypothetical protein